MEMSSSQEWMGNKQPPKKFRYRCKSKFDTDLDMNPSRDNIIVSKNNRYVKIGPGSLL